MRIFQELGSLVETRWKNKNYDEDAFPEIASCALSEFNLPDQIDAWDIVRWVHSDNALPPQDIDSPFGNPPITLYSNSRFHINIYFWLDGTTDLHMHGFAGAFQVLLGSSIHSHYQFQETHKINLHFRTGRINLQSIDLLELGDIKEISAGDSFIHSLFHLDRPSATITIRTYTQATLGPQFSYHKPHIAYDPFFRDEAMIRKVQTVSLLLRARHPQANEMIGEFVSAADFQTAYAILLAAFEYGLSTNPEENTKRIEWFENLMERARSKHGDLVDLLPAVFEERERQEFIVAQRRFVSDRDHRFFLALLLNVPNRAALLDIVRQRFPERDPVATVVNWVDELSKIKFGDTNLFGISGFDKAHLFVLQYLLEGSSAEEIRSIVDQRFGGSFERVDRIYRKLTSSIFFKSLV